MLKAKHHLQKKLAKYLPGRPTDKFKMCATLGSIFYFYLGTTPSLYCGKARAQNTLGWG